MYDEHGDVDLLDDYTIDGEGRFSRIVKGELMLFASDDCVYCKKFSRSWKAIKEASPSLLCVRYEMDHPQARAKSARHRIDAVPTLVLRLHGRQRASKYFGNMNKRDVMAWLEERGAVV